MNHHNESNNIIPTEQKEDSRNTFGTIDQLLINKMIQEDAKKKKKNLLTAWIDYKKAWIIDILKILKFNATTTKLIETTIKELKTSLHLTQSNGGI